MTYGGNITGQRVRFRCTDPEDFGPQLATVAPGVTASHLNSNLFAADVVTASLPHIGLFSVRIENAKVLRVPSQYIAVTVPLDHDLKFFDGLGTETFFPGSAHILWAEQRLDLSIDDTSTLLVVTYPISWIKQLNGLNANRRIADAKPRGDALSLGSPEGRTYWRHLNYLWSEICSDGIILDSPSVSGEIERSNATLFLNAIKGDAVGHSDNMLKKEPSPCISRAESYIRSHLNEDLSLSDLVSVAGCSASSLLRAFRAHRGTTPMRYARQLRLEAAHRIILAGNPRTNSISEVAVEFGFFQLGRFAADYKKVYGELPSAALARQTGS